MALDLKKISKAIDDALKNMTQEELDECFPPDNRPKGWISIEDSLPECLAIDVLNGGSIYKVKDKNGKEFESKVCDHTMWYYEAKEAGITHWWHE